MTPDSIHCVIPEPIAITDDKQRRFYVEKKAQRRGMNLEDVCMHIEKPVELTELRPDMRRISVIP